MKTLAVISELLDALDVEQIPYVHWKSNEALARSADGRNDLDLLVDRPSLHRMESVLDKLGFLAATPPAGPSIPGIHDFYGLDLDTDQLVHVHLHDRLVLGDDATKNYSLPVESAYLASRTKHGPFWVPSAEWEYLVFVCRMVLKHCPPDVIAGRRGRLTPSEKRELAHLETLIDTEEVERLRAQHLPEVDSDLWADARRAIDADASMQTRAAVGLRFQQAVTPYGDAGPLRETLRRNWRRSTKSTRRLQPGWRPKRTPRSGGLFVSFVGSDGSGKSTAVAGVVDVLGHDLWVKTHHLGKPPRSLISRVLRRATRMRLDDDAVSALTRPAWETPADQQGPAFWLWHTAIARDRAREIARIRREVEAGAVVITDRFPRTEFSTMDCPRIELAPEPTWLARRLAALEARYYERSCTPDLMLVLVVKPETALERSGQDREFVARRAAEVAEHDWDRAGVLVLDGESPAETVRRTALSAIWAQLTGDRSSLPA